MEQEEGIFTATFQVIVEEFIVGTIILMVQMDDGTATCRYTKIGRLVHCELILSFTTI